MENSQKCVTSGFRREADEKRALLGYYAASGGHFLTTFRDNLSVPSSEVKLEPIGCPETSIRNCHYLQGNNPEKCSSQELKMLVELKPNFVRVFGTVGTWKEQKCMSRNWLYSQKNCVGSCWKFSFRFIREYTVKLLIYKPYSHACPLRTVQRF